MSTVTIHVGSNLDVLPYRLSPNSVDAIVTDPPYELGFMGKSWDASGIAYNVELWKQCLRVLKPGGHLLAFSGSRTYHRMTCAIEDAGFEVRDQIMWVYGSGFPKSLNVSKAIDATIRCGGSHSTQLRRTEQETGGESYQMKGRNAGIMGEERTFDRKEWEPVTHEAKRWVGWGTALKPAHEPICVARKPLEGTVANNVMKWNTGAMNIDATRVCPECGDDEVNEYLDLCMDCQEKETPGRWPANLIHDGSQEVLELFPGDTESSAARFFYCPKASKKDRDEGVAGVAGVAGVGALRDGGRESQPRKNFHPTVKPTDLMRYLCRLVTPPGGTVLDPFMGSGSTGRGAVLEGFDFIGVELSDEYAAIAKARIDAALRK